MEIQVWTKRDVNGSVPPEGCLFFRRKLSAHQKKTRTKTISPHWQKTSFWHIPIYIDFWEKLLRQVREIRYLAIAIKRIFLFTWIDNSKNSNFNNPSIVLAVSSSFMCSCLSFFAIAAPFLPCGQNSQQFTFLRDPPIGRLSLMWSLNKFNPQLP